MAGQGANLFGFPQIRFPRFPLPTSALSNAALQFQPNLRAPHAKVLVGLFGFGLFPYFKYQRFLFLFPLIIQRYANGFTCAIV